MERFAFPVQFTALDAATALYTEPYFIWLDSSRPDHPQGRYSYVLFFPTNEMGQKIAIDCNETLPPFRAGLAGFKTYEGEEFFQYYHQLLSFDHQTGQGWFVITCANEAEAHKAYDVVCTKIRVSKPVPEYVADQLQWTSNFTAEAYKDAVATIIERILNGDIFQANLTHTFCAKRPEGFNAFAHYLYLRTINPAPFAAFLNWGEYQISSASPESFLNIDPSGKITTRPIKGTDTNAERLNASAKDRAENVMIVDLLRNDISKVCTDESVTVTKLCELQSFAGLHHLVSEITGQLRSGQTARDALDACFPGGSITGAPKIMAMDILCDIERIPRGVYCGAIGWIGNDGAMDTNISIRTLVTTHDTISFGVGGGITALSDPQSEYDETLLKAAKIFKSFEGAI